MVDLSGFAEPLKGLPTVSVNPLAGLLSTGQQRSDTQTQLRLWQGPPPCVQEAVSRKSWLVFGYSWGCCWLRGPDTCQTNA